MDQIDRLVFDVQGRDRGGSKVLDDASKKADAAHLSMSKLGSTLSGLGGPFEQVINYGQQLAGSFDSSLSKAQKLGLGLAATGAVLIGVAAKDQQAQRQLQQAVDNTGDSYSDYRGQIDEAIKHQEGFAHTADDTQNALNVLVTATQDTTRSLDEMGLVAEIAAEKHESLAEAADQLVKVQAGSTRAFRSFGIVLDDTLPKSEAIDKALKQLTDRLSGQASASVDTFVGHLKVMETRIHDNIAALGKYGPEITAVGAGMTILASVLQLKAARQLAETAATVAATRAEVANAAARERTAAAAGLEAAAIQRATFAQSEGALIGGAMGAAIPGLGLRGIGGKLLRGGGYAIGGQVVGSLIGGTTGSVLSGAGYGAAIGSLAGPLGTAAGALVGGGVALGQSLTGTHIDTAHLNQLAATEKGYQKLRSTLTQLQATAAHTSGQVHDLAEKGIEATKAALKAGEANHEYTTSLLKESDAAAKAALSLDGQIKALQDSTGKTFGLSSAEDALQTAMHNLAQSVHDGSNALHGHSLAAETNRNALRDAASKMLDLIAAQKAAGVSGDKVRASALAMADALEKNAVKLGLNKQAVDHLLQGLGVLPPQIAAALGASELLAEQVGRQVIDHYAKGMADEGPMAAQAASVAASQAIKGLRLGDLAGGGQTQSYVPKDTKAGKAAQDYAKWLSKLFVDSYAPAVDSGVSDATQKALDSAKQKAQAEAQYMHTVLSEITGAYQNTKQSLIDQASLANRQTQGTDILGATGPGQSILASKRRFAHQIIHFAKLIDQLHDAHYKPIIVDEVEGLGTEAGIQAAQELLAGGKKERRAVNRAEERIQRASARIAASTTAGDYGPEIVKALQKLPDQFDRKFEHTLRKLNIITDTGHQDRKQGRAVRAH